MQLVDFFKTLVMFCFTCVSFITNAGYFSQVRDFVKEHPKATIAVGAGVAAVALWYTKIYYSKTEEERRQWKDNKLYCGYRQLSDVKKNKYINNLDQFKLVMGISENDFVNLNEEDKKKFIDKDQKVFIPHVWVTKPLWRTLYFSRKKVLSPCNSNKKYPYGDFRVDAFGKHYQREYSCGVCGGLTFNIIEKGNKNNTSSVDIISLISKPKYNGAFVQVASRFNCLEGKGRGVSHYTDSRQGFAQGESVATATLPASIYRYYFLSSKKINDSGINLLQSVIDKKDMKYGLPTTDCYTSIANYDWGKQSDNEEDKEWWRSIRIGLHTEVTPILTDISPKGPANVEARITNNHGQQVTLVLTSALNLSNSRIGHIANLNKAKGKKKEKINTKENLETFAKGCLMASYHYTLSAASQRVKDTSSRQKVLLTMMGGGVFENKTQWIVDAIQKSLEAHRNNSIDVILILYTTPEQDIMNQLYGLQDQYKNIY